MNQQKIAEVRNRMKQRKIMYNTQKILINIFCVLTLLMIFFIGFRKDKDNIA